jgi:CRP-like cAMP-binding protein
MPLSTFLEKIPEDELKQFEHVTQISKTGKVIIREGDPNDNTLYLLRAGTVGVFRNIGEEDELVAVIKGMSFFGEMELMAAEGFRSATCKVLSEYAVVYVFKNPDIKAILHNPMWSEILVTRLVLDLHEFADRIVQFETSTAELKKELEYTNQQSALLLAALDSIQNQVANELVGEKESSYAAGVGEMVENFVKARLPLVYKHMKEYARSAVGEMDNDGLLPRKLKDLMGLTGKKSG